MLLRCGGRAATTTTIDPAAANRCEGGPSSGGRGEIREVLDHAVQRPAHDGSDGPVVGDAELGDRHARPVERSSVWRRPSNAAVMARSSGWTSRSRRSTRNVGSSAKPGRSLNVSSSAAKISRFLAGRPAGRVGSSAAVARIADRRTMAHFADLLAEAICGPSTCRPADRPAMSSAMSRRTVRRSPPLPTNAVEVRSALARPADTRASSAPS
jgi:hypothetical protein